MKKKTNINLIYLMGTGRSGTTALATILGNHKDILTVGEINQFYKEIEGKSADSTFWNNVYTACKIEGDYSDFDKFIYKLERHSKSLLYFLNIWPQKLNHYEMLQKNLLNGISKVDTSSFILDSSKYVSRALLLNKNQHINIKIINVVRDPRGLIWSFKKKVQTTNSPLKTVLYYWVIHIISFITKLKLANSNSILTIRYEDIISEPKKTLHSIGKHINLNLDGIIEAVEVGAPFEVPDIIGGNRLKTRKEIIIKADLSWQNNMSTIEKYWCYFLTFPLNLINRYKP